MAQNIQLQLKALRKLKKVTQKDLADAIHVSFQTISKWENGTTMPDITFLPPLAKYFEVELEVLLGMKPIEQEIYVENYASEEYWAKRIESMKNWKLFHFNEDYLKFLVECVWKITKPVHMLDLACGYGYLAEKLLPHMPEGSAYTGVDISEDFLKEGRRLFQGNPQVEFIQGDVLSLELPKKYDMVISQLLLSYLPDAGEAICKMKALLKPEGMLVAIDQNLGLDEESFFIAKGESIFDKDIPNPKKVWQYSREHGEMNYRTGTELPFLFKRNGLKNIQARMSDLVFVCDGMVPESKEKLAKYKSALEQMSHVTGSYAYYLNRGINWQDAEKFVEYQEEIFRLLEEDDVFVSRASCLYIVWGEQNG